MNAAKVSVIVVRDGGEGPPSLKADAPASIFAVASVADGAGGAFAGRDFKTVVDRDMMSRMICRMMSSEDADIAKVEVEVLCMTNYLLLIRVQLSRHEGLRCFVP